MSFLDDLKKAGNVIKNAGESVAGNAFNGTIEASKGLTQIIQGDPADGMGSILHGSGEATGLLPPELEAATLDDAMDFAIKEVIDDELRKHPLKCYSLYRNAVRDNLAKKGIQWKDSFDEPIQKVVVQLNLPLDFTC